MTKRVRARYSTQMVDEATGPLRQIQRQLGVTDRAFGKLKGTIITTVAAFGVREIIQFTNATIEAGDKVQKLGLQLDVTVGFLSQLEHAAPIAGASLDDVSKSIGIMSKALGDAANGMKQQRDAIDALGLSLEELIPLDVEERFFLIGDRLNEMGDDIRRARVESDLFGRSGRKLRPLFLEGAEGLRQVMDNADRLGATMSEMEAQQFADFEDAWARLTTATRGSSRAFASWVADGATPVVDWIAQQGIPALNDFAEGFLNLGEKMGLWDRDTEDTLTEQEKLQQELEKVTERAQGLAEQILTLGDDMTSVARKKVLREEFYLARLEADSLRQSLAELGEEAAKQGRGIELSLAGLAQLGYDITAMTDELSAFGGPGGPAPERIWGPWEVAREKVEQLRLSVQKYHGDVTSFAGQQNLQLDLPDNLEGPDIPFGTDQISEIPVLFSQSMDEVEETGLRVAENLGSAFVGIFEDAKDGALDLEKTLKRVAESIADAFIRAGAQNLVSSLLGGFGGSSGSSLGDAVAGFGTGTFFNSGARNSLGSAGLTLVNQGTPVALKSFSSGPTGTTLTLGDMSAVHSSVAKSFQTNSGPVAAMFNASYFSRRRAI